MASGTDDTGTDGNVNEFVLVSDAEINRHNVKELKEDQSKHVANITTSTSTHNGTTPEVIASFAEGAYWEELTPKATPIEELQKLFPAHAPTIP
eukprot:15333395-Ditylum_brightwellii.AAC.1